MNEDAPLPFSPEPTPEEARAILKYDDETTLGDIIAAIPNEKDRERARATFESSGTFDRNQDFEETILAIDGEMQPDAISERADVIGSNPELGKIFEDSLGFLLYDAPPHPELYKLPLEDQIRMVLTKYPTPGIALSEIMDAYDEACEQAGPEHGYGEPTNVEELPVLESILENVNPLFSVLYRERFAAHQFIEQHRGPQIPPRKFA